jgi:hypothetical protein
MKKPCAALFYLVAACCFSLCAGASTAAAAEKSVTIKVPAIVQVNAGSETPLPLKLETDAKIPAQAMLLIRGIPSTASLNAGRHFPSGVWAIKLSAAGDLRITTAANIREDAHLILSLVTLEGEYLSNVLSRLVIAPASADPSKPDQGKTVIAAVAVEEARPDETAPHGLSTGAAGGQLEPIPLDREDMEKILKLMQKGDQYLLEGKIVAARRFYEYAADMGWPDGAAAIARTFDPEHLKRFSILGGIQSDPKLAQEWYEKSRDLASRIKVDELLKLGQN